MLRYSKLFAALMLLIIPVILSAQPGPRGGGAMPAIGRVYGKLLDGKTKEAVGFATVQAWMLKPGGKDTLLTGALTEANGDFNLENLPLGGIKFIFNFMGYEEVSKEVKLTPANMTVDLGNITMGVSAIVLNEVTVAAEKSTLQLKADRKVFNVDKNLSSIGGTAEDVLRNVPSVSVDGEGNAALRNQNAMILIDGRPTNLTLNQIPSAEIEQVEVITNPGARFDANTTGGILNIVMKKNRKPGYNGMITTGWGTNNRWNAMGNLNVKQGKLNVSLSYNLNRNNNITKSYNYRTDFTNGQPSFYFDQESDNEFSNLFQFAKVGIDYNITNRNTISFGINGASGDFNPFEQQVFTTYDGNKVQLEQGRRTNDASGGFKNLTLQGTWRHNFPEKGKELILDGQFTPGRTTNKSTFTTYNVKPDGTVLPNPDLQLNDGGNTNKQFQLQLDYIDPVGENGKMEMGLKTQRRITDNFLNVNLYDYSENIYQLDSGLTTNFYIDEWINAAYFNYTGSWGKWGYVAGVRFEQSIFNGEQRTQNVDISYEYPGKGGDVLKAFFPSLYLTRKINEKQELQTNFSRKINRPNFFQIMPFFMFADKYSYRIGNPGLRPEFVNLAELNYSIQFGNHNLLSSAYLRQTEDPITNVITNNPNDPSVLITTFINGDNQVNYGLENTLKLGFGKWLEWTHNLDAFYTTVSAGTFTNSGYSFNYKTNFTFRLPKAFTMQGAISYDAPRPMPQGQRLENFFSEISVKKDINESMSVTASLVDIFNTRRWASELITPLYIQESSRRRDNRHFRVTFNWRFGKQDASLFRNRRPQQRGNQQQGGDDGGGFGY